MCMDGNQKPIQVENLLDCAQGTEINGVFFRGNNAFNISLYITQHVLQTKEVQLSFEEGGTNDNN